MSELETLRRLAPPVEPAGPEAVARMRARAFGRRAPRPRRARWLLAPAVTAAALALAVVLLQAGGPRERAFAAAAIRAAEGAPRLLVDGWTVTRVDEWSAGTGEMTFAQGSRELELSWVPAHQSGAKVGSRGDGYRLEREIAVPGGRAEIYVYVGSDDYVATWRSGDSRVTARGGGADPDDFAAVLRRLEQVGARDWLGAMPASAVTPREQPDAVDGMLADLPLPPGLDVDALRRGAGTRDRYQVGVRVAGAVACGWLGIWARATADGDGAAADRAAGALATSHDWAILHEMNADGDYPEVLWQYADAVAAGGTIDGGKPGMSVAATYRDALCG